MNFLVDSLDKIDPPLSTQCRVVALPTRQYSATRRFAVVLPLLELHGKSAISAIFLHTKQQKTFQGTLGTQDLTSKGSKTSLGPSMDPTGPLNKSSKFWNILEPLSGYVYHF